MKPKSIGAGILGTTALVFGGVDASKLDEKPIERIETVAGYTVEAKQIENRVETSFPWKDQPAIKVVYDMGKPTLAEKFKDKRKKEVVTEAVNFGDGGFKVDILLDEKPNTNVFCYAVQGAENYDFFYQPPLTEQEIAEGASRPPEIDGSYAVYHKTLKNHQIGKENYATGKVMHIPRPQVWSMSDVETKVWADMNYDNGDLCVTVPQDFLDKAEYPVRVDPTFGYTSIGATLSSLGTSNAAISWKGTAPTGATQVDSITGYFDAVSGTVSAKVFMADSAGVILTNGIAPTISGITTTQAWYTSTYGTKPNVTASLTYNIAAISGSTNFKAAWDTSAGNGVVDTTNSYSSPQSIGTAAWGVLLSIYATYTASGGSSSTTPNQNIILFE